jgi:hypothetical protein
MKTVDAKYRLYLALSVRLGEDLTPEQELESSLESLTKQSDECIETLHTFELLMRKQFEAHIRHSH